MSLGRDGKHSSAHDVRRFDAVVVGSGFGGSIAALRLAEAGRSVFVLERGERYEPGEFPRDVTDVDRLFWRYPSRSQSRGLFDVRFFSGLATVVASGVGGGSLIYANVLIRPDASVFDDPRWPRSINLASLAPYYDKVEAEIGPHPIPADATLKKRSAFHAAAAKLGRDVVDPPMSVNWPTAQESSAPVCQFITECEFGCNVGAKRSVDRTYLHRATRLGALVSPRSLVTRVESIAHDGFSISYVDLDTGAVRVVQATRVVLAAGTLGTNELLLRCRDEYRTLPAISSALGTGYSANGDFLGSVRDATVELEPWVGPDVTSVIKFFDTADRFTMAAPTFNAAVMNTLAGLGRHEIPGLTVLAPLLWKWAESLVPFAFSRGWLGRPGQSRPLDPGAARMTNLFAIGRDNANGRISLTRDGIDIKWDYAKENAALIQAMERAMRGVAAAYGGTFDAIPTWKLFGRPITVHSLGGCAMSDSPSTGVVTPNGEVYGHPGLFIADGSVIPTSIGFHPVLTIAAMAERVSAAVVRSYGAPDGREGLRDASSAAHA
jgi:cholesterol oxidase